MFISYASLRINRKSLYLSLGLFFRFQKDLQKISATIDSRNATREEKYIYLNPREVPNAISI